MLIQAHLTFHERAVKIVGKYFSCVCRSNHLLSPLKGVPFEHYIVRMFSWLIKTIRLYMNDLEADAGRCVWELCSVVSDCNALCTSKWMPITQITLESAQGTLLPLTTCPSLSQTIAF